MKKALISFASVSLLLTVWALQYRPDESTPDQMASTQPRPAIEEAEAPPAAPIDIIEPSPDVDDAYLVEQAESEDDATEPAGVNVGGSEVRQPSSQPLQPVEPQDNGAIERFEQALASEPVDPYWSPMMESVLQSMLASGGTSFAKVEPECRTSVCRVVLTHEFGAQEDARTETLALAGPMITALVEQSYVRVASFGMTASPDTQDGNLVTTFYLARGRTEVE